MTDLFKPTFIRVGIPHNTVRPPTLIRPPTEGGQASRQDVATTELESTGTTYDINMPTYVAGDLVVVGLKNDDAASDMLTPTGWNQGAINAGSDAAVYWRKMNGSEGATVEFSATAAAQHVGAIAIVHRGLDWDTFTPDFSSFFSDTGATIDPPQVSMTHGDTTYDVYVFGGGVAGSGQPTITDPSPYTEVVQFEMGPADPTLFLGHRQVTGEVEDPGTFATDNVGTWELCTFAVAAVGTAAVATGDHNHDHGALTGLADDDHSQYLNVARHDADDHSGLAVAQPLAFSKTGTLEVTTGVSKFPALFDMTLIGVRAAVGTAPTGADLIVDVNLNGTTVYTTQGNRPTISDGSTSSTETVPDVTAVSAGDLLSVDIDQIGSSTAGSDLVVAIEFQEA